MIQISDIWGADLPTFLSPESLCGNQGDKTSIISTLDFLPFLCLYPCLTSAEHVLSLKQLDNGGLSGGNQDDAAIFSATHQSTLRWDVHAGCHLKEANTHMKEKYNGTQKILVWEIVL